MSIFLRKKQAGHHTTAGLSDGNTNPQSTNPDLHLQSLRINKQNPLCKKKIKNHRIGIQKKYIRVSNSY